MGGDSDVSLGPPLEEYNRSSLLANWSLVVDIFQEIWQESLLLPLAGAKKNFKAEIVL